MPRGLVAALAVAALALLAQALALAEESARVGPEPTHDMMRGWRRLERPKPPGEVWNLTIALDRMGTEPFEPLYHWLDSDTQIGFVEGPMVDLHRIWKSNAHLAMKAVEANFAALSRVDPKLKGDVPLVMAAALQDARALKMSSCQGQIDDDRFLQVVMRSPNVAKDILSYASPRLRRNAAVVLAAVKRIGFEALEHADRAMLNNEEFVLEAMRHDPRAFAKASSQVRSDTRVVMSAVRVDFIFARRFAGTIMGAQDEQMQQERNRFLYRCQPGYQCCASRQNHMLGVKSVCIWERNLGFFTSPCWAVPNVLMGQELEKQEDISEDAQPCHSGSPLFRKFGGDRWYFKFPKADDRDWARWTYMGGSEGFDWKMKSHPDDWWDDAYSDDW